MTLGILTCTTKNRAPLYKLTNITKMKFASSNLNIKYVFDGDFNNNDSRKAYWNKILFCRKHIKKFDWIMWMDDDAGIIDQTFNIEAFIEAATQNGEKIIAAEDENGFNCGIFLMKNDEFCISFLDKVYNELYEKFKNDIWPEQNAMKYLLSLEENKKYFKIVPGYLINAHHPCYISDVPNLMNDYTFIVHVAGGDGRKIQLFRQPGLMEKIFKTEQCLE